MSSEGELSAVPLNQERGHTHPHKARSVSTGEETPRGKHRGGRESEEKRGRETRQGKEERGEERKGRRGGKGRRRDEGGEE